MGSTLNLFGAVQTRLVRVHGLERMERSVSARTSLPPFGWFTMILHKYVEVVVLLDPEGFQARLQVHVLLGRPLAAVRPVCVDVQSSSRNNFHGAVEAELAVVHVHALFPLSRFQPTVIQVNKELPQAPGQEDSIGIDLHRPVVEMDAVVTDDLAPDANEDRRVVVRMVLATEGAMQVDAQLRRLQPSQIHVLIGVDGPLFASEDAPVGFELHLQQRGLIPPR